MKQRSSQLLVIQKLNSLTPTFINFLLSRLPIMLNMLLNLVFQSSFLYHLAAFKLLNMPFTLKHSFACALYSRSLWKALKCCSYSTLHPRLLLLTLSCQAISSTLMASVINSMLPQTFLINSTSLPISLLIWISQRYLRFHMPKTKHMIFPLKPSQDRSQDSLSP